MSEPVSFYEAAGGEETFSRLVHRFYELVADDPTLRPVYPAKDLGPAEEHLRLFLMQYWGGPRTYDELRGHPRLRMRHARFRIGEAERDAWLRHMRASLDELALDEALDAQLWDYLVMAAHSLLNYVPDVADLPDRANRPDLGLSPRLGDLLVSPFRGFFGSHTGEFLGFRATGRAIEYVSHEFYRIADGLIAEEWICSDLAALFRQIS